jgi:hypothetical protein
MVSRLEFLELNIGHVLSVYMLEVALMKQHTVLT